MSGGSARGARIGAFARLGSVWANRAFLRDVAEKFRLEPLVPLLARRITSRSFFKMPPILILQVTEACNLRCTMCYEWGPSGHRHQHPDLGEKPVSLELEVVERLMEECRQEKTFYSLFGGEPLLYPDLDKVIARAKQAGSSIETVTNGTLLSRKAAMLVEEGMDLVRVSLDGPREINDLQRGRGSYEKAVEGLEALYREKARRKGTRPLCGVITTVTSDNCTALERLYCRDLDLRRVDFVTIQMQSYITEAMGRAYQAILERRFGQKGAFFWKGMTRDPDDFRTIDLQELLRQFRKVRRHLLRNGIPVLCFPGTWDEGNLAMYLRGRWQEMRDYKKNHCIAPWVATDVTARGDVAPCHTFYDLAFGNLHSQGMGEIWNGEGFKRFRTYMRSGLLPVCPACCHFYGFP